MNRPGFDLQPTDDLLVVAAPDPVHRFVRDRYPHLNVQTCPSYFSAMAKMADPAVRWVVGYVHPDQDRLPSIVRGMREAAGANTRIVLCCTPSTEQTTRLAAAAGADDYVLDPPLGSELDAALRMVDASALSQRPVATAQQHDQELSEITQILQHLDVSPSLLLDRLAGLLRLALTADGVEIMVDGATGRAGSPVANAVLIDRLRRDEETIGRISLGPSVHGAYTPDHTEKLTRYTTLISGLLAAARRNRHWQTLAFTDDLSKLPNRRFLFVKLDDLLDRAARQRTRVTALICDIDDFKRYNDTYGHNAGDEIIRETGKLLRTCCRKDDHVIRYGGDEFVIVFWDADQPRVAGSQHPKSALHILERFREALSRHEFSTLGPEAQGRLTISGGLATFPWDADNAEKLLNRADDALLQAKRSGKNRIFLVGRGAEDATDVTPPTRTPFKDQQRNPNA
jgi:diguanylate cyclase (GGDEF)-like protein